MKCNSGSKGQEYWKRTHKYIVKVLWVEEVVKPVVDAGVID
jgi:hypothetical protein